MHAMSATLIRSDTRFYVLGLDYQMAPRVFGAAGQHPRGGDGVDMNGQFCGYASEFSGRIHSLRTDLHWSLTPWAQRNNPHYRHLPGFMHANVAKLHHSLNPDDLFALIRRPRIDNASDPRLVRTPSAFWQDCLRYDLEGPDGIGMGQDSFQDGQGIIEVPLIQAWEDDSGRISAGAEDIVHGLREAANLITQINQS